MKATLIAALLAATASLMLVGAADAQLGRSSKNPEAGPAGAFRGYGYGGYRPYPVYPSYPAYRSYPFYRGALYDRRPYYAPAYGY